MVRVTGSSWRTVARAAWPGLRRTALLALACNAVLELSQLAGVDGYPWAYKTPAFVAMFGLGFLVLWAVVGLVHAVVGRIALTSAALLTTTAVVAGANYEKVRLRQEPLYPSDWRFAGDPGFLAQMVGVRGALLAVAVPLVLGSGVLVAARALRRRRSAGPVRADRPRPVARGHRVAMRVLAGAVCALVLTDVTHFSSPSNAARATYDALGASWRPWSQERNYLGNGFVGGVLYNLDVPEIAPPTGYSAAEMGRVVARCTAAARRINATRGPAGLDGVNVVMVLSESFSDPTALRGVRLGEDPIPFTRRLMGSTTAGPMLAQNVGGGTANMEFETLTGMSASGFPAQLRVPYQSVVPNHTTFPSAVGWAKATGHRAVALHPFTTEMYRRREVYRTFGFDDFVYDRTMHDRRRIGHHAYISDASAFGEVQRVLAVERSPVFMNVVTMQNHIPYRGRYDDPVTVAGPDGSALPDTGQYARGLSHTDRALEGFIDGLRRIDEPTVVVFYGDHLPASYPQSVLAANTARSLHQTPFFVWANFPGPSAPQPTTSPTHFMDLVFERADAAVPPYYALLTELRREIPADEGDSLFDASGRPVRRGQVSARGARLLRDYRLVQYDLSGGKRYSEAAMFAPAPPS